MGTYTISDLEKITGVRTHTIRIWERRYNIMEPERTSTNFRHYSDKELKKLLNISILCQHGMKIGKIAFFNDEQINAQVVKLCLETNQPNVLIDSLVVCMIEMDDNRFVEIYNHSVAQIGIEETFEQLLFPFLERVGLLWQTNSVIPSQEHFISNLIRQKLIAAIENEMATHLINGERILFFLPENEFHELVLLFYSLIARKLGLHVIYLGASVPLDDIKSMEYIKPAQSLFITFTTSMGPENLSEYLKTLTKQFSDKKIYISGRQLKQQVVKTSRNVKIITSASDFKNAIQKK
jgi:DNA-binding transcriptional MerR regulator